MMVRKASVKSNSLGLFAFLGSVWGLATLVCGCGEKTAEDMEQQYLEREWRKAAEQTDEKTGVTQAEKGDGDKLQGTSESQPVESWSDTPIDLAFDFIHLSPLMQGYFSAESSQKRLSDGLRRDPHPLVSPVVVRIRWIEAEYHLGRGEIGLVYDRPVGALTELQPAANALLQYRNHVGGAFDMRLLSFSLYIEGQGREDCRIPLLNKSGLSYGLLSPCIEVDGEKRCLKEDGTMPLAFREGLDRCFTE